MLARNSGKRPSEIVQIESEITALDFDLTCTLRLATYDNQREVDRLEASGKMMEYAVAKAVASLLGHKVDDDDDDSEGGPISEEDVL